MKFISDSFYPKCELERIRKPLVYFHDFGKGTDFFQLKIANATLEKGSKEFIEQNRVYINSILEKEIQLNDLLHFDCDLSNHAEIGAYFFLTEYFNENLIVNLILFRIIKRHHGNLTNFIDETQYLLTKDKLETINNQLEYYSLPLFSKIYKNIQFEKWENIKSKFKKVREIKRTFTKLIDERNLKYFFFQHFMYSLLLSADKGDVSLGMNSFDIIKENRLIPKNSVDFYKEKTFSHLDAKPIDIEREEAYKCIALNTLNCWENKIFSITLPTGLGKTFAAYNAAIKLQNLIHKEKGYCPRIIYCLPFTSIIDQNTLVLTDILSENNIPLDFVTKNHYLSTYNDLYDKKELTDNEAEYLADGWEQEFIVTTFVQLLESIFTNRNKSIRKFHNMANAIIILDEVQNIPAGYIEVVRETFLKMAEYFNTRFILVSATQPIIFKSDEIIELTDPSLEKTKGFFTARNRIELDQSLLKENNYKPILQNNLLQIFKDSINENSDKSILIICNTIAQSQFYYDEIKKSYPELCTIYLSSSILPKRRKQIIKLIKRNINNGKRMILISTQVVEAGVDIDFDIVFRDFAPLDSINQSAGRCNRNGIKSKGAVKLFNSGKAFRIYDSILLNITERIFKEYKNIIQENKFYEINRKYFKEVWKNISENNDKSIQLKTWMETLQMEEIQNNFKLIDQDLRHYNVFIPYCHHAKKVWKKYQECFEIEDFFERKFAIKKIKPELLMYVAKFPKNKYQPDDEKAEDFLIYEESWKDYYNLITGFNVKEDDNIIIF
ncbi:MAG: CRISPR-associated helicase Cas3' [Bacteroidales bacterium]|nr:CRISPR-associated helicase Cas3' [Bacteroidales bacterium]